MRLIAFQVNGETFNLFLPKKGTARPPITAPLPNQSIHKSHRNTQDAALTGSNLFHSFISSHFIQLTVIISFHPDFQEMQL